MAAEEKPSALGLLDYALEESERALLMGPRGDAMGPLRREMAEARQ